MILKDLPSKFARVCRNLAGLTVGSEEFWLRFRSEPPFWRRGLVGTVPPVEMVMTMRLDGIRSGTSGSFQASRVSYSHPIQGKYRWELTKVVRGRKYFPGMEGLAKKASDSSDSV